jgi:Ankyrin repeat
MPVRHLPVVPNLDQLKHQAKDLLRALHNSDPAAIAELREFHPGALDAKDAKLADAQHVLARSYEASSWPRLVQATQLVSAIWSDDLQAVRDLVTRNPHLIHEDALVRKGSNWGPPMTYAANLGRDGIIQLLHSLGATDLLSALDRALLQGQIATAKMLHSLLGHPVPPPSALSGPAYTLNASGTQFAIAAGAPVVNPDGARLAPVDVVLETDSRNPAAKHAILQMYADHGLEYPDTLPMALHRGRIDLLEQHLNRNPALINRTFTHREIYPAEMGCGDPINATVGTPLGGTTLLHMCVDYNELEIFEWLIARGADVNTPARVGTSGFGGYTALFNTVVCQTNFWSNRRRSHGGDAPFTELLLANGAHVNVRASIWKELHPGYEIPGRYEYRDVTALSWGRQFHVQQFVSAPAMQRIRDAGGTK